MELNVGMDVSLKETSICVVDDNGEIVSEGVVISEPATIAAYIRTTAPHAKRIGLRPGGVARLVENWRTGVSS